MLFLNSFLKLVFMFSYVYLCGYVHVNAVACGDLGSPEAIFTDCCESPDPSPLQEHVN